MAEAASLLEKYSSGTGSGEGLTSAEFRQTILKFKPDWEKYDATKAQASHLKLVEAEVPALKNKMIIQGDLQILKAAMDALTIPEEKPVQWILTLLYDMLREDSSCFSVFEEGLKQQIGFYKPLLSVLERQKVDQYIADKAAWLLSAVIGNVPRFFSEQDVKAVVTALHRSDPACSDLGILEAIVNILKSDSFRVAVWTMPEVSGRISAVSPQTSTPPYLYKCIFALWMLSFEPEGAVYFKEEEIIKKIRDVLTASRTEKVVRLSLTVLRNFLTHKVFAEHVVELGVLEVVQQLEFEKWRDAELYDDIRDMAQQISAQVQEMSNFDRYERELKEGQLRWGFIHSSKFWSENVLKFEQNDFRALKMLASLLHSEDMTTLAVACHDIGEFVSMHPLGKKMISNLQVKERVMELMGSVSPTYREVRREALLCCQKIMLNKWQDMDNIPK
eukprot:CAMPEP_0115286800 /NCGR_PEP_ID=MMETSP0270-20121206/62124_1 /TAXON_ID=71861 /ORGANISM="Scrippsiella trochoidea, Strain CCMP3099" /LENGTH=445 /DNA_ID=CAMNT_0002703847 /DNA_START=80 /DNA_END=1417 /DNA_ORIENTATION=+